MKNSSIVPKIQKMFSGVQDPSEIEFAIISEFYPVSSTDIISDRAEIIGLNRMMALYSHLRKVKQLKSIIIKGAGKRYTINYI